MMGLCIRFYWSSLWDPEFHMGPKTEPPKFAFGPIFLIPVGRQTALAGFLRVAPPRARNHPAAVCQPVCPPSPGLPSVHPASMSTSRSLKDTAGVKRTREGSRVVAAGTAHADVNGASPHLSLPALAEPS